MITHVGGQHLRSIVIAKRLLRGKMSVNLSPGPHLRSGEEKGTRTYCCCTRFVSRLQFEHQLRDLESDVVSGERALKRATAIVKGKNLWPACKSKLDDSCFTCLVHTDNKFEALSSLISVPDA